MRSFFLPNWSPPDDPARPLPAEGRPWPSDDDDENGDGDGDGDAPDCTSFAYKTPWEQIGFKIKSQKLLGWNKHRTYLKFVENMVVEMSQSHAKMVQLTNGRTSQKKELICYSPHLCHIVLEDLRGDLISRRSFMILPADTLQRWYDDIF